MDETTKKTNALAKNNSCKMNERELREWAIIAENLRGTANCIALERDAQENEFHCELVTDVWCRLVPLAELCRGQMSMAISCFDTLAQRIESGKDDGIARDGTFSLECEVVANDIQTALKTLRYFAKVPLERFVIDEVFGTGYMMQFESVLRLSAEIMEQAVRWISEVSET